MPAQKLTKARLAQILIMLSILVVAFFWRTFTHETLSRVDCSQKERCDVTIGGELITIKRNTNGILIETPKSSSLKIDLDQSHLFIDANRKHQSYEWETLSHNKIINLRINNNTVAVQL